MFPLDPHCKAVAPATQPPVTVPRYAPQGSTLASVPIKLIVFRTPYGPPQALFLSLLRLGIQHLRLGSA